MSSAKKTTTIRDALRAKAGLLIPPQVPPVADRAALDEGSKPIAATGKDYLSFPPIESQFKFSTSVSDAGLPFLQTESLLGRAAELLERCAAERAQYDLLRLEKWKLQVDQTRRAREAEIHSRERKAGVDTLPYQRALLEGAAEKSRQQYGEGAESQLKALVDDLLASGFNKRMTAKEVTAWVSCFPLKDQDLTGDNATYIFDGAVKTKADHLYDAARIEADELAWEQVFTLMSERYALLAQAEPALLKAESHNLAANWCKLDIAFRSQRAQVAADVADEQAHQAQVPGGVLNYQERMAAAERRFSAAFRDALANLTAARRGLKDLFDYAPPFPDATAPGYFDQVDLWTAAAKSRVAEMAQLDQTYVLALSVKDLAKTQWEPGRTASQWTFDLPAEMFKDQAQVRLRGLSLALTGPKPEEPPKTGKKPDVPVVPEKPKAEGYWSAQVSLPPTATTSPLAGASREIDQKTLPVCFLGRVTDRDSNHEPEIAGAQTLRNASPIGKGWKLSLSPKSTDGMGTEKLQDVLLYLHVSVRSTKA